MAPATSQVDNSNVARVGYQQGDLLRKLVTSDNSPACSPSPPLYSSQQHQPSVIITPNLSDAATRPINQPLKKLTRSPLTRGTRGRGDPRNARMKADRNRYEVENRKIKYQCTQTKNVMSTQKLPQSPAVRASRPGPSQQRPQSNKGMANVRNPTSSPGRPFNALPRASPRELWAASQQNGAVARRQDDWTTWNELNIRLFGLTANISTRDIWKGFSKEGSIVSIELFEDSKGTRDGRGVIRFRYALMWGISLTKMTLLILDDSPPPMKSFWQVDQYPITVEGEGTRFVRLELLQPRRTFLVPSPVNPQLKYPEIMLMKAESVDFGFMYDQTTMMSMYRAVPTPQAEIQFRQNMHHREVVIEFQINISDPRTALREAHISQLGKYNRTETLRFCIPFSQVQVIHQVQDHQNEIGLVISMETPPKFFRKLDEANTHEEKSRYWNQNDAWYRQTQIVYAPSNLKSSALTLKKTQAIIDIGRWTTYRFCFDMLKNDRPRFNLMSDAFRDHNVEIKPFSDFKLITEREPAVWEYIDKPVLKGAKPKNALDELMIEDVVPPLAFPVRYQLEVCISQGCLNEHNMTKDFVNKLINMNATKAQDVLEYVANQKKRIYDPMEIFKMNIIRGFDSRPKIPYYCVYTRSATVTPSTVYYNTPTVETSNRVIRQYSEHADRFLRVRFTDEKLEGRINPTHKDTMNEVFTRIYRTMVNGIVIGDREYKFLAFGNSQFREHGAYFIAPLPHFSAQSIRRWMGSFKEIKVVAKHAARLGQCFSTTRAISGAKATVVEILDIERNGFCFTDGVGKISTFLAQLAASELGITQYASGPPSVFQFRLGGCKGVLAVSPDAKRREIHIRPSQYKFPASHEGLEIIRWSQFAVANLNRQLILVLSALGVPDETFMSKLKLQLSNLEKAMTDEKVALALLQKDIDANQMTLTVAGMILDGFQKAREPFVTSLLQLWRAWSIKYLKEKARITISKGALLLGCVDETGTLKGHFDSTPESKDSPSTFEREESLPEIFVQLSKGPDDKPIVIQGPMILGRNPSLHPGDLRIVRGVDVPALHHLKDVIVFPQTGDRDIASMCSGGDLDGDDYLVMWDKELLPRDWNAQPMNYKPPQPLELDRDVTTTDITSFFVTYMKNDTLPTIAHAHLALADWSEDGVRNEKCLKLAALHSMAVDYVKTGEPAIMPRELSPRKWPHFMEKRFKPKEQIYISEKVLGKLYDQVERVDFVPAFGQPFDKRILNAYNLEEDLLEEARDLKIEYDAAMHRIMAQHEIRTEFEVWSTFVLHHAGDSNDYKFHEVIGELSNTLKHQFREVCYKKAGGKEFQQIGPFVAAMYQVTFEEMAQAVSECHQVKIVGGQETRVRKMIPSNMPLMSFPWLFQGVLGRIATGSKDLWQTPQRNAGAFIHRDPKRNLSKKNHIDPASLEDEDVLETAEGVTHRGEVLELFENLIDYEPDEPRTASEIKANSDSTNFASTATGVSVDDMLFGNFARDLVGFESNGPMRAGHPKFNSDSLMDASLKLYLKPAANENVKTDRCYRASSSESIDDDTPTSSQFRLDLLGGRQRPVEESTFSTKNHELLLSKSLELTENVFVPAYKESLLGRTSECPNESNKMRKIGGTFSLGKGAETKFNAPKEEYKSLFKKGNKDEWDTEELGAIGSGNATNKKEPEGAEEGCEPRADEEIVELDTTSTLLDQLLDFTKD